jgi:hypothetical protein
MFSGNVVRLNSAPMSRKMDQTPTSQFSRYVSPDQRHDCYNGLYGRAQDISVHGHRRLGRA